MNWGGEYISDDLPFGETRTFTAKCDGGVATANLYLHDKSLLKTGATTIWVLQ